MVLISRRNNKMTTFGNEKWIFTPEVKEILNSILKELETTQEDDFVSKE